MQNRFFDDERIDLWISWAAWCLLLGTASAFATFVPSNRAVVVKIYQDFHLRLPAAAALVSAIPQWVILAFSVGVTVTALMLQIVIPAKRSAAVVHVLATILLCVLFLCYREAMGNAFLTLVQGMSGGSGGR